MAMEAHAQLSDKEVHDLIAVVDDRRDPRAAWWTFGLRIVRDNFSLQEQLAAVQRLGLSGNARALTYLRELCLESTTLIGSYGYPPCEVRSCQNARGALRSVLVRYYIPSEISPIVDKDYRTAHAALTGALSKLEQSIGDRAFIRVYAE